LHHREHVAISRRDGWFRGGSDATRMALALPKNGPHRQTCLADGRSGRAVGGCLECIGRYLAFPGREFAEDSGAEWNEDRQPN